MADTREPGSARDASSRFPACLFLDLEVGPRGDVREVGALLDGRRFHREPLDPRGALAPAALDELDDFARAATRVAGHNLIGFDLPRLAAPARTPRVLALPAIDTLVLSPLAFPTRPYHRLVKDYKLVHDARNDPVADARLAAELLRDEADALRELVASDKVLADAARTCLFGWRPVGARAGRTADGTAAFLATLGASCLDDRHLVGVLGERLRGAVCDAAWPIAAAETLADPAQRPAVAFAARWISVAATRSVLPQWVWRRFPGTADLVRRVRDAPCGRSDCAWCLRVHDPVRQAKAWFGIERFRGPQVETPTGAVPAQEAVVRLGFAGRPHLAIFPTGFGKSICYQLPALVRHARTGTLTVVLSPLQALMKDQVDVLDERLRARLTSGVEDRLAVAVNGLLTPPERADALERVRGGETALLYIAPEQLRNRSVLGALRAREIGAWVFDEAHCLSKWGHDFRTDYFHAGRALRELAQDEGIAPAPVACFTATAKADVRDEIVAYFQRELSQTLEVVEIPPERTNLTFSVREAPEAARLALLEEEIRERLPADGKAIVYLATRARTERAARFLTERGVAARAFHAGMEVPEKREVQDAFKRGDARIVCATSAFGMGIDEPNVRLVVHADAPSSLESYLQEAGRAGRDERPAHCTLLFHPADLDRQFGLLARGRLTRRDIAQILGSVRRAQERRADLPVVVTAGEILRDDRTDVSFDAGDRDARTKVTTAVSWLERGAFLERDENHTRVFQGRPRVRSLDEARAKMDALNLSPQRRASWEAILRALLGAGERGGLDMDELAAASGIRDRAPDEDEVPGRRSRKTAAERLVATLHGMVEAGLLDEGLFLTAFVRHGIADDSPSRLATIAALEKALLDVLVESAPDLAVAEGPPSDDDDAEPSDAARLDLRLVCARLAETGHATVPEALRRILFSLAQDGRRFGEGKGSLALRHLGGDRYLVRLRRSWDVVRSLADVRHAAAGAVLATILTRAAPHGRGEVLADFGLSEVAESVRRALPDRTPEKSVAAAERALLYLHEQRVITLQQGLAVFRQAMGLRLLPKSRGRSYTNDDYRMLEEHYAERDVQVHVAGEYARLGLESPARAARLVAGYFAERRDAFVGAWFAGREEELTRATSRESYGRIVDDLGSRTQQRIVTAPLDQDVLVLAGPGSGKTRVVVHRCAYLLLVARVPPESVIVLCFNRAAAHEIRVRLRELAGDAARGVGVHTYHGLALRLTGRTIAADAAAPAPEPAATDAFDAILREANALLRGETPAAGMEPDLLRDRLLSGFQHILVDEYQDVDAAQYELLSALAGRRGSCGEREERARVLAVGDDDQNVYGWRHADARYLRQFRDDYDATVVHLVDNYRSTAHIVAAANLVIAPLPGRMKASHAIRVARARRGEPRGGPLAAVDRLGRGRVQVFDCAGRRAQVATVAHEIERLRTLPPGANWDEFAVLARTHEDLAPIRAWCESRGAPVRRRIQSDETLPLVRIREIAGARDTLRVRGRDVHDADGIQALLGLPEARPAQPWLALLHRVVEEWRAEMGAGRAPAAEFLAYLDDALADQRRGHVVGEGLFLGTVHGAKGLEFPHVFVLDGGWGTARDDDDRPAADVAAEERRLYYVAMTRAQRSLHLLRRRDRSNPFAAEVDASGERFVRERVGAPGHAVDDAVLRTRYETLGMPDVDLGWAGRHESGSPGHRHIAALATGASLSLRPVGSRIGLFDALGNRVGSLSTRAQERWTSRLTDVRSARVAAIVLRTREDGCRTRDDGSGEVRDASRCDTWEVPIVEVVTERPSRG